MSDKASAPEYGDYSRLPRMAELRMIDSSFEMARVDAGAELTIDRPGKACFYFVKRGRLALEIQRNGFVVDPVTPGMAVVLEDGACHRWRLDGHDQRPAEMLVGNVDRRHTIIQKLSHAVIVMPANAAPHAEIIANLAAAVEAGLTSGKFLEGVRRRFSEIIQLQMHAYAQERLERIGPIPAGIRHDAPLLRAWTAFLNEPERRWTLAALAALGGISRSAFALQFERMVGMTPMAAMRWVRIHYAADMVRTTKAPIAEIALKVGYQSDVALMRAFRGEMGVTPAEWRLNGDTSPPPRAGGDRQRPNPSTPDGSPPRHPRIGGKRLETL